MKMNMNDETNSMMSMEMSGMYFHGGFKEYMLFEFLQTETKGGFAVACILVFLTAIGYEVFKNIRATIVTNHVTKITDILLYGTGSEKAYLRLPMNSVRSVEHILQTFMHLLHMLISYCLMLVFSTYNLYLCLAVVLGAACGYFLMSRRDPLLCKRQAEQPVVEGSRRKGQTSELVQVAVPDVPDYKDADPEASVYEVPSSSDATCHVDSFTKSASVIMQ